MWYFVNLPDSTDPCILLIDDKIYISEALRNPIVGVNNGVS